MGSGEQILDWLRGADGPLSGADLARRLGCSRAAVWKRVAALRRPVGPGEQILDWLRGATGPLSGADLARRLGCSRAAVWKHVAALRRAGYEIRGTPSAGYVLGAVVPVRLGPAELAPYLRGGWRRVEWRAEIDSTQHLARDLARAGAPEGTVVVAESQTGGRGRLGRQWHSPPGVNLYCSLVLRPTVPLAVVPGLALVAGLAVVDAVA